MHYYKIHYYNHHLEQLTIKYTTTNTILGLSADVIIAWFWCVWWLVVLRLGEVTAHSLCSLTVPAPTGSCVDCVTFSAANFYSCVC